MIDTNALYHDTVSGRQFVRIRRKLDTEFRIGLIRDGHKMLAYDDMADLHDMAQGWTELDETAVETNAGDFRNMADLTQVDRYGQPVN